MPAFPFPITGKHFIGISPESLDQAGVNPARVIVPAWFGFRTTVEEVPQTCVVDVTGRSQFKLFINGESILFGPCRSRKEIAYYDTIDLAPYLVQGENRILMQVYSYPEDPMDRLNVGPNYCFGDSKGPAVCIDGTIGDKDPGEPENWKVWIDAGMGFNNDQVFLLGANECADGRVENPLFSDNWDELITAAHVQPMTLSVAVMARSLKPVRFRCCIAVRRRSPAGNPARFRRERRQALCWMPEN